MHESTISRVTTQKYMHTPRGLLEFKYFFSSHVGTSDGGECSATANAATPIGPAPSSIRRTTDVPMTTPSATVQAATACAATAGLKPRFSSALTASALALASA
jgi:hypothetical protein